MELLSTSELVDDIICLKCKDRYVLKRYRYCEDCLELLSQMLDDDDVIHGIIEGNEREVITGSSSDYEENGEFNG